LLKPEGAGPFPAIVAMHGCGGRDFPHRDAMFLYIEGWTERLSALGYVVLLPDSFRPRGVVEVCTRRGEPVSAYRERPRDAYGAAAWLRAQPFVDPEHVFLMGWSHGASTTLATVRDGDGELLAGLRQRAGGPFRAAVALYPRCAVQIKSGWTPGVPLLVLIGSEDDWTPAPECRDLADKTRDRNKPFDLVVYPGAYHAFDAPDHAPLQRRDVPYAEINGKGYVTIAADPAARADAYGRLPEFLAQHGGAPATPK
jgi:dienelactone hydrolase